MTLPLLELTTASPAEVLAVLQRHGAALVRDARVPVARSAQALADAAAFFALPAPAKAAVGIAASLHFRGYSEMHNERDWREQIHFGSERPAVAAAEPFWRLQGPNLWPADPVWRARMLEWLHVVEQAGRTVLAKVATALGLAGDAWLGDDPYLLMKLIAYHPQPAGGAKRQGVAAHLDFSLVTLTLQDAVGGLAVQGPDGRWCAVPCVPGAWLVTIGELLAFVTGQRLLATPHRVVNPSTQRSRYSIPVFVNPSLTTVLCAPSSSSTLAPRRGSHVHAVLEPGAPTRTLPFGSAEWRRKGENVWCEACHAQRVTGPM